MNNLTKGQKIFGGIVIVIVLAVLAFFIFGGNKRGALIDLQNKKTAEQTGPLNQGNVSPLTGVACDNWNRRPLAVMQPGDVEARPPSGFSQADMVFEMPVITASITRLMAVYGCNTPPAVGSMRSARHDFIHLAKGLGAIFVSWGRSESHSDSDPVGLAKGILDRHEIDNINCNGDAGTSANACSVNPCYRKDGFARGVDSGYSDPAKLFTCAKDDLKYSQDWNFSGYAHQAEVPIDQRGENKRLRVAYAGAYEVEYQYNRDDNDYERFWGNQPAVDRNNNERIKPKNVAVLIAQSEQIEGQYNNVQLGDPWYDHTDSGDAYYYMNGQEIKGTWKKDKSKIDSKLQFLDADGNDIKFVPGQIWVNILEPGQGLSWK